MTLVPKRQGSACVTNEVKCLAIDLQFLVREQGSPLKPRSVSSQARFPIKVATMAAIKTTEFSSWSAPKIGQTPAPVSRLAETFARGSTANTRGPRALHAQATAYGNS
jgi:hypothetical protein